MKVDVDKAKTGHTTIKIDLDSKEWQKALDQAAAKISESTEIKGFRSGKAPVDMVVSQVGEARVLSEAADTAINQYYVQAVSENDLIPLTSPKVSVEEMGLDKPLSFKVEVVVMPEIELGDYRKIKVQTPEIKIDPGKVEEVLKTFQRRAAEFKEVERKSKTGDWVEIDFEGKLDGKTFEGGQSKNHPMIIGDGVFLPEFEEALVGLGAGETKTFDMTFPKDYGQPQLAGKKVEFTVKVHKVKEVNLPEINDELAKKVGPFKNLDELKSDIEKWAKEDEAKKARQQQQEKAMEELIKITKVEVPSELVDQELSGMIQDLGHQLSHQGSSLEDYLKKQDLTEEKLKEQWKDAAKKRVIAGLALNKFKRQEGIEATDKEVEADIERMKSLYPNEKDKIEEKYKNDLERRRLKHLLSGQKALEHLLKIVTE